MANAKKKRTHHPSNKSSAVPLEDELPDVRDGLTRKERLVLWVLSKAQAERNGRDVPLSLLYGLVLEHMDMSSAELQEIVARLGARR